MLISDEARPIQIIRKTALTIRKRLSATESIVTFFNFYLWFGCYSAFPHILFAIAIPIPVIYKKFFLLQGVVVIVFPISIAQ